MDDVSGVPFDHYQRYAVAARTIDLIRDGDAPMSILEVGSNTHRLLGRLLPADRILYLDREVPDEMRDLPDLVLGDATALELPDASHDVVVALDVYEHIPAERRELFLGHLGRVASRLALIGAPFDDPAVAMAEIDADATWRGLHGGSYRWLDEHRDSGLPDLAWTIARIEAAGFTCLHVSHGELALWTRLMKAHFAKTYVQSMQPVVAALDRFYNEQVFSRDFSPEHAYRKFVFYSRDAAMIERVRRGIDALRGAQSGDGPRLPQPLSIVLDALPVIAQEVRQVADRAAQTDQRAVHHHEIAQQQQHRAERAEEALARTEQALARAEQASAQAEHRSQQTLLQWREASSRADEASARAETLAARVAELEPALQQAQARADALEQRLRETDSTLAAVMNSTAWRATAPVRQALTVAKQAATSPTDRKSVV